MKMRLEPNFSEAYRKDPEDEAFLARFNEILSAPQEAEYRELPEIYPTLHIIGVPRSGTTLLTQLLAAHTNIGYINHLIAAFWRAPVYGIQLSKKLLDPGSPMSYTSEFGRTKGISEPHEFGYFWSSLLNYRAMQEQDAEFEEQIDWNRLCLILKNMTHAFGRAIVFKSFLLGWHMVRVQRLLPMTCWIRIRRDPLQTALSILHLREKMFGSKFEWASLRPKEYQWLREEPYWRQVAGQVFFIDRTYSDQLQHLPPGVTLDITYRELCDDPARVLQLINGLLARNGWKASQISAPPNRFHYHRRSLESHPDAGLIRRALLEFETELNDE
jgi:hypothetical protein